MLSAQGERDSNQMWLVPKATRWRVLDTSVQLRIYRTPNFRAKVGGFAGMRS